jgi:hypothetical protein
MQHVPASINKRSSATIKKNASINKRLPTSISIGIINLAATFSSCLSRVSHPVCRATKGYLANVEERYVSDAYNSLSIEGYLVTDELIERVARGDWNPDGDPEHLKTKNALAARGYYQAFQAIKASIEQLF